MEEQSFGNLLSLLRKESGLSQQQIAEKLNVSNKTISKWECGQGFPEITQLLNVSALFNISVDELLKGIRLESSPYFDYKNKINNALLKIKTTSLLALFTTILGLSIMYTISFSTNRAIIGFGVVTFSIIISILYEAINTSKIKNEAKSNNYLQQINNHIIKWTYIIYATNFITFLISIPIISIDNNYMLSISQLKMYLLIFPIYLSIGIVITYVGYKLMKRGK